jgi:GNAT superfamily N-acetyltransferase
MKFRPVTVDDAAALSALILRFSHDFTVSPDGADAAPFFESISANAVAGYIADPRYRYLAAFDDAVLAGFIAIRDGSHVFHLFVAPEFQRHGLATRLWQLATASGKTDGFTVNSSRFAVPVYERFGFVKTGPQVEKHGICFVPMRLPPQHST